MQDAPATEWVHVNPPAAGVGAGGVGVGAWQLMLHCCLVMLPDSTGLQDGPVTWWTHSNHWEPAGVGSAGGVGGRGVGGRGVGLSGGGVGGVGGVGGMSFTPVG
jgi:hypothetical protein